MDGGFNQIDSVAIIFALSQWFVSFSLLASFNKFNEYTVLIGISSSTLFILVLLIKCDLSKLYKLELHPKNKIDTFT